MTDGTDDRQYLNTALKITEALAECTALDDPYLIENSLLEL